MAKTRRRKKATQAIEPWQQAALDTLKVAESIFLPKRYDFTIFICQQTVETLVKYGLAKLKGERPPSLHRILQLLVVAGIEVPLWFDPEVYSRKNAAHLVRGTRKAVTWVAGRLGFETPT
jgi:HEPN domain-containing protein